MSGWIGITLGDATGIGPEIVLKALAQEPAADWRYLLIGDPAVVQRWNRRLGLGLKVEPFQSYDRPGHFFIFNPLESALPESLATGSAAAAQAAMEWLEEGARRCLRQEMRALVTAPVNKQSIIRSGRPFVGQTEFLAGVCGVKRAVMMLLGEDERGRKLRVALATTHVPLAQVPGSLSREGIEWVLELAAGACARLGLAHARLAVCGLNPHAGEGGEMGREEIETIGPAVEAARKRGICAEGPLPADTVFYHAYQGHYDVVVAMYHDQGLPPLKMIGFERGVNWTLGLPFIRTSPDHGTAYDIAGRGVANPSSLRAALRLAQQLVQ